MTCCLIFCRKDITQASDLITWIGELDVVLPQHELLLVAASTISESEVSAMVIKAKAIFSKVSAIKQREPDTGQWPQMPNKMFRAAWEWVRQNQKGPWALIEPDCVPLASGWLDALASEYHRVGKPFFGAIHDQPYRHLNGVMVYPQDVAKYNQFMPNATDRAWDLTREDLTMRHGHGTHLIQRALKDPSERNRDNQCYTFPTQESLRIIRDGCVLWHGVRDSSLINRLRERRNGHNSPKPLQAIVKKVVRKLQGRASYYHSGNLGDVIYALNAIRLHGGGDLVIGPEQLQTRPCSMPINQAQFKLLEPLLNLQPYIKKSEWQAAHPKGTVEYDLNRFRNWWVDRQIREQTQIENLCHMHCHLLDVGHLFDPRETWLTVGDPIWTGKIIVHRSQRHQSNDFPWRQLVDKYANKMLFVGRDDEWRLFQQNYGCRVSFYAARDFLDMARVIAGGIACVANQSLPCAIALGLGQRVLQEVYPQSPDCRFQRETFLTQV